MTSGLEALLVGTSRLEPTGLNGVTTSTCSEIFKVSLIKAEAWGCRSCVTFGGV